MNKLLKRIRGVVGTAITWAGGWGVISAVFGVMGGIPLNLLGLYTLTGVVAGALAGGSFALLLSVAERRSTLSDLSLRRVAIWGGIGGAVLALLPLAFGMPLAFLFRPLLVNGLMGAGFATGSVFLAKKGDDARYLSEPDDLLLGIEAE